jgi:hypothetical protein
VLFRWLAIGVFMNGVVQVPFATIRPRASGSDGIHLIELLPLPTLWWMAHRWGSTAPRSRMRGRGSISERSSSLRSIYWRRVAQPAPPATAGSMRLGGGACRDRFAASALLPGLPSRVAVVVLARRSSRSGRTRVLDVNERRVRARIHCAPPRDFALRNAGAR